MIILYFGSGLGKRRSKIMVVRLKINQYSLWQSYSVSRVDFPCMMFHNFIPITSLRNKKKSIHVKFLTPALSPASSFIRTTRALFPQRMTKKIYELATDTPQRQNIPILLSHSLSILSHLTRNIFTSNFQKTYLFPFSKGYNFIVNSAIFFSIKSQGYKQKHSSIINNNKGMFYQFNFDTQAHLEQADYSEPHEGKHSLPTTTHNSPGSDSSMENELCLHHEQDSFEENTQVGHANAILSAAQQLMDDSGMSYSILDSCGPTSGTLEEVIQKNKLLRSRERSKLLAELQKESELCGLLTELMLLFSLPAFQEVLFVVHNLWQKHYLPFRQSRNVGTGFLPKFSSFVGWAGEEQSVHGMTQLSSDADEVRRASEQGVEQLARELFYSKKLKLLTFSEGKQRLFPKRDLENNFLTFVRSVSRSVFLSGEGFYGQQSSSGIFSEEEEMQCEAFELEECRFVRAFSQIQADNDTCFPAGKRRKME